MILASPVTIVILSPTVEDVISSQAEGAVRDPTMRVKRHSRRRAPSH
jgi:hypothetical protein